MWETAHRSLGTQQLHSSEAQIEMLFWLIDSRGRLLTCKRKQENEPALLLTSDLSKSFPDEFVTETVLLWILWEGFQSEQRFNGSPEDPHRCEAVYLQNMQEVSPKSLERSSHVRIYMWEKLHLEKKIWRGSASWRHSRGSWESTQRSCILVNCAGNGSLRAAAWRSTWGLAWAGSRFLRDVWEKFQKQQQPAGPQPQSGERGSFQAGRHRAETSNHRWWRNHLWLKCPSPRVRALLEELWMHQPRVWTAYSSDDRNRVKCPDNSSVCGLI